ncbi:putative rRNA-processing protein Efg1 [Medicago truncatula]|uniref:rRNA-processing protein EFG1 n=1 Tax=Medicago truncatula TaxID=3880 RepID=A0A396JQ58_MEDTR|nr:rRNA-processing protein EFG1 isoform X1 [Medicago truncatula]RHN80410.1 putative rRNA-processing protein Efg1 [Medicago truncatula]
MAHGGGVNKRRERVNPASNRRKTTTKKFRPPVSLKNQIRSAERMLRKNLPAEVREAQEQKLEALKKQQDIHTRLAVERKIFLRDKKIKFFERRKIERRIRRLEKLQRASSSQSASPDQLASLKQDLQYVMYFPKNEKYVPLFSGTDDAEIVDKRNGLRKQIEDRLSAAAASGKDLEETGSEDDGLLDLSDDDFFLAGSSSDEADADDELTDKSTREQASGKAVSGMSSDEKNQRHISARALMPPPRPSNKLSRFGSAGQNSSKQRSDISTSRYASNSKSSSDFRVREPSRSGTSSDFRVREPSRAGTSSDFRVREPSRSGTSHGSSLSSNSDAHKPRTGHGSSLSSNSDAHKPRRKRRPKKKKKQE